MSSDFDPSAYKVVVLAGGRSGEREISLASGKGAQEALIAAGFDVEVLDPAKKEDLGRLLDGAFDVAFLCLHGKYGEDGTIQGFLETIGLPYTCSGVWSSALAMDKVKSKKYYLQAEIPTPPAVALNRSTKVDADAIIEELGGTCVVKPGAAGSALGVFVVDNGSAAGSAIEKAFSFDDEVLVEKYVAGTELTVAVIGGSALQALPVIEIVPTNDFYDFESKYEPGGSQHICPARLSENTTGLVQEYALRAHRVLGCKGVSRSDFILDDDGQCWILETNTIPGMTATSLLPDAAAAAGISFPELCTMLVKVALE